MGMIKSLRAKCGAVLLASAMVASSVFIPGVGDSIDVYKRQRALWAEPVWGFR